MERHIPLDKQRKGNRAGLLGRPVGGFRWSREHRPLSRSVPPLGPWLVPQVDSAGEPADTERVPAYTERGFPPFRERRCVDLHRQFAKIATVPGPRREEAILTFANKFGFLGSEHERVLLAPHPRLAFRTDGNLTSGEPYRFWWAEACEMAALLALWGRVAAEDRGEVAKYVYAARGQVEAFLAWHDGRLTTDRRFRVDWRVPTAPDREADVVAGGKSATGEYRLMVFPELKGGRPDVLRAARLFLFDHANRKLWGRVSPQLRAEADPGEEVLLYPDSLLATVWLMFVDEMVSSVAAGTPCAGPGCPNPIVPRWGRRYCSDACRSRASYKRRKANQPAVAAPN